MTRVSTKRASGGRRARLWAALGFLALLAGCAGAGGQDVHEDDISAQTYYNDAADAMGAGQTKRALELFDTLSRVYPYSVWAAHGQIMAAYAAYRSGDFKGARLQVEHYLLLHPSGTEAPYALYLKAVLLLIDVKDIHFEQDTTQEAASALKDLIGRFRESPYAESARMRLAVLYDQLAAKDLDIARQEEQQRNFSIAIRRLQHLLMNYDKTNQAPEALYRLTANYINLGLEEEAFEAAALLSRNFPKNRWYQKTYGLLLREGLLEKARGFYNFLAPSAEPS